MKRPEHYYQFKKPPSLEFYEARSFYFRFKQKANFINSTFAGEKLNSEMKSGASLNFINSIFMNEVTADDTVENISVWTNHSLFRYGEDAIDANLVKNFNWGVGMLSGDPLFLDTLDTDFHLKKKSTIA